MHVREKEEESTNGIPQSGVCQSLLILSARTLDHLGEGVENLTGNTDSFEEVSLASWVDEFLAGVVPVEVHDGFLES